MAEFAEFNDVEKRRRRLPVVISQAGTGDVEACAYLAATREGEPIDRWVASFTRAIEDTAQSVLVAHHGDSVVGYGKAAWMQLPEECNAPSGWYLTGVVVEPSVRRRGVGESLTLARLAGLQQRGARQVWFSAIARNEASLALHARLGFREVTREFTIPGVNFSGANGVLARWEAPC